MSYTQVVTISTDDHHTIQEFRASVGAQWTFLSDPGRTVQKDLDIQEHTDPEHDPMVPHTLVLKPGLVIHDIYNGYIVAQIAGAIVGVIIANLMFALPAVSISTHLRSSPNLWFSEVIATFGLLLVIFGLTRGGRGAAAPFAVGAYILGAYFFTSSASFANPAVTIARTLSDTFAGIAPSSVIPFVIAQLVGASLVCATVRVLWPGIDDVSREVVAPHESEVGVHEVEGV